VRRSPEPKFPIKSLPHSTQLNHCQANDEIGNRLQKNSDSNNKVQRKVIDAALAVVRNHDRTARRLAGRLLERTYVQIFWHIYFEWIDWNWPPNVPRLGSREFPSSGFGRRRIARNLAMVAPNPKRFRRGTSGITIASSTLETVSLRGGGPIPESTWQSC